MFKLSIRSKSKSIPHLADSWAEIRAQAVMTSVREPLLLGLYKASILDHGDFGTSLAWVLAQRLQTPHLTEAGLTSLFAGALRHNRGLAAAALHDLQVFVERDPAVSSLITPFLHHKGFHALQAWRFSHWLWAEGRKPLALWLQNRISEVFAVDIHPAARIGEGIFIDHATGVVVGETAVIEDNVSLLHEVTLGGTGKATGLRHPHIESGVLIGAGAKILGHVRIGANAKVGAGSVVLSDVPANCTVVGVPGRVVGRLCGSPPALAMDQSISEAEPAGPSLVRA